MVMLQCLTENIFIDIKILGHSSQTPFTPQEEDLRERKSA